LTLRCLRRLSWSRLELPTHRFRTANQFFKPLTMYKHFPTKDELLVASLEEFIARANVIPD